MFYRLTVFEGTVGVRFRNGRLDGTLPAGRYWLRVARDRVAVVPLFDQTEWVAGQEMTTKDGATLRLSATIRYRVDDVAAYFRAGGVRPDVWRPSVTLDSMGTPGQRIHIRAQTALRDWVAARSLEEAMAAREQVSASLTEALHPVAKEIGLAIEEAQVVDFSISGNLRAAYSDLLKAELEGKSALQRARNEATTMRNLLNTARLVREHPGLLELRALASAQKPRVSFVVGTPAVAGEPTNPEPEGEQP